MDGALVIGNVLSRYCMGPCWSLPSLWLRMADRSARVSLYAHFRSLPCLLSSSFVDAPDNLAEPSDH